MTSDGQRKRETGRQGNRGRENQGNRKTEKQRRLSDYNTSMSERLDGCQRRTLTKGIYAGEHKARDQ